jgi:glycosyltransferase involved in cell wall biosynthesis
MKVALYYPWIYLPGGPERTILEILARSRHSWTLFTNHYDREATFPALRDAEIVELGRVSVKRSFVPVAEAAFRIAFQKMPMDGFDAILISCDGLGDLTLLRNSTIPAACLCFTPLRAAFDPYYQENYLARAGGRFWREPVLRTGAAGFRIISRHVWKRYRRVFAISSEVKRRILAGRLCPEEKIDILYPGIDSSRLVPSGVYEKNFLIPGRIMWTKNLELGIESFKLMLATRPDLSAFTLTIAGHVDQKSQPYFTALQTLASTCPNILFRTSLSDEELFGLCSSAYAVLYPPFNEDWGLIPLEAMSLEKPVIAVNRGGPCETVTHGETGYLVEPRPAAFAHAMTLLADNPEIVRRLGRQGRKHVKKFEWTNFCSKLDDGMEGLAEPFPSLKFREGIAP